MTYSEIYEAHYGHEKSIEELDLSRPERAAWAILQCLDDRGGFDHWWDPIDEEDKDEIFAELVATITQS